MTRSTTQIISFLVSAFLITSIPGDAQESIEATRLADAIIVGLLSEEQFRELPLPLPDRIEIFKAIRDKRGWTIEDNDLAQAVADSQINPSRTNNLGSKEKTSGDRSASGGDNQYIIMEYGTNAASYPISRVKPNAGECGSDNDDIVLVYNTPRWPSTDTTRVRSWSQLWWVRFVMSSYSNGGMAAHGLLSPTTRACIGSKAKWLGADLQYLYLWHK